MLSKYTDNIYPTDLEIKDTTDAARSAQYIDIHNEIDREVTINKVITSA
jgi:hypothetical protein